MKKTMLALLTICSSAMLFAQDNDNKKKPTIAVAFTLTDFRTATLVRSSALSTVMKNGDWSKISQMNSGLSVSYLDGLSNNVDFVGSLNYTYTDYPYKTRPRRGTETSLLEADAGLNIKLLNDNHTFVPYLHAGVGVSWSDVYWGAYVPVGGGFQLNLGKNNTFLFTNMQYRLGISDNTSYHFFYSLGMGAPIGKKKR